MNPSQSETLLQRLSEAIDEPGGIRADLLAEAQADPEAREFLAFWNGEPASAFEQQLPPCGIALRDGILKLADLRATHVHMADAEPRPTTTPRHRWQPWFSGAAAATIAIGVGWLLYEHPVPRHQPVNAKYNVTPQEIAAIHKDIDNGLNTVAKPLSAVRMTLAKLD